MGVEKSFAAFDVAKRMKIPYAEFQLEESWRNLQMIGGKMRGQSFQKL